jgi:hypothetical protein
MVRATRQPARLTMDPQITRNIDLRNIGKGLAIGLSMLYGASRANDYALEQLDKRLDEVKHDTHEMITREADILRAEIRELRDHEAKRQNQ